MHKYVFFGPQGSGKGTQSQMLCDEFDFVHISIGEIFRWHVAHHTKLAAEVKRITDSGELVPDEIVSQVMRKRLAEHDWKYGFVLDGFPRTLPQAEYLFQNWDIDRVIYLDLPDKVVYERIMHRAATGERGGFTKRLDDNPETLRIRLLEYQTKTRPLLDLYQQMNLLIKIDGNRPIQAVYKDVRAGLGLSSQQAGAG
jgi:adenylate kinase